MSGILLGEGQAQVGGRGQTWRSGTGSQEWWRQSASLSLRECHSDANIQSPCAYVLNLNV